MAHTLWMYCLSIDVHECMAQAVWIYGPDLRVDVWHTCRHIGCMAQILKLYGCMAQILWMYAPSIVEIWPIRYRSIAQTLRVYNSDLWMYLAQTYGCIAQTCGYIGLMFECITQTL